MITLSTEAIPSPLFRWEHLEARRYYQAYLAQDLFGDWVLTRVWGGIQSARGQMKHTACQPYSEGIKKLQTVHQTRLHHGYKLIT